MSLRQHCARVLTTDAVGSCDLEYTFQLYSYVRLPERMVLFDAGRDVRYLARLPCGLCSHPAA